MPTNDGITTISNERFLELLEKEKALENKTLYIRGVEFAYLSQVISYSWNKEDVDKISEFINNWREQYKRSEWIIEQLERKNERLEKEIERLSKWKIFLFK